MALHVGADAQEDGSGDPGDGDAGDGDPGDGDGVPTQTLYSFVFTAYVSQLTFTDAPGPAVPEPMLVAEPVPWAFAVEVTSAVPPVDIALAAAVASACKARALFASSDEWRPATAADGVSISKLARSTRHPRNARVVVMGEAAGEQL